MSDTYFTDEEIYTDKIRMVANGDPVDGGTDGPVNKALKGVANRTAFLKKQVEDLNSKQFGTGSIADKAITYEKLADEAVTTEKLANEAVTADKIEDGTITGDKLAPGTIPAAKINMDDLQTALTEGAGGAASFIVSGVAAAPNYYERSECYKAADTNRYTVKTPEIMWLNINNQGYGISGSIELDLSKDAAWSANAQEWQASHYYEIDDVVYPLSGKTSYDIVNIG